MQLIGRPALIDSLSILKTSYYLALREADPGVCGHSPVKPSNWLCHTLNLLSLKIWGQLCWKVGDLFFYRAGNGTKGAAGSRRWKMQNLYFDISGLHQPSKSNTVTLHRYRRRLRLISDSELVSIHYSFYLDPSRFQSLYCHCSRWRGQHTKTEHQHLLTFLTSITVPRLIPTLFITNYYLLEKLLSDFIVSPTNLCQTSVRVFSRAASPQTSWVGFTGSWVMCDGRIRIASWEEVFRNICSGKWKIICWFWICMTKGWI